MFYLETVATDGLVTRTRIKAMMKAGSSRYQQAAHFGAVTLKNSDTFTALQPTQQKKKKYCVGVSFTKEVEMITFISTHHQVEGSDGPVS